MLDENLNNLANDLNNQDAEEVEDIFADLEEKNSDLGNNTLSNSLDFNTVEQNSENLQIKNNNLESVGANTVENSAPNMNIENVNIEKADSQVAKIKRSKRAASIWLYIVIFIVLTGLALAGYMYWFQYKVNTNDLNNKINLEDNYPTDTNVAIDEVMDEVEVLDYQEGENTEEESYKEDNVKEYPEDGGSSLFDENEETLSEKDLNYINESIEDGSLVNNTNIPIENDENVNDDVDNRQDIVLSEKDTDGDGLSDIEEDKLGTDITLMDTDKDQLNDREEVFVYHTDPLNPDTDGDGYLDGQEVVHGYNPNGEGKLNLDEVKKD